MSTGLLYELEITGMSFLTGVGLMMVYDLLRLLRLVIVHKPFWIGVEDFCFWIYAAVMTFGLLYELNEGTLRGYAIDLYHNYYSYSFIIVFNIDCSVNLCFQNPKQKHQNIRRQF